MKLYNGTIRPGTVLEVLENGNIKASAPGLFSFEDDPAKLPPIMPWFIGSNCNSYSQPLKYDDVWIMNFTDNPQQLYWFRKDRMINNENLPMNEENIEIVCNRDVGGDWCSIYFSDGSGWVMSKGDSMVQIKPDGSINLNPGFKHRIIDVNAESISLGSMGKSEHQAAYGDVIADVFLSLITALRQVQMAAMPNPMTAAIGAVLATSLPLIEQKLPEIVSPHVTLD